MNNGVFEDPDHNESSCYVFPDSVNMPFRPKSVKYVFDEQNQLLSNNSSLDQISISNKHGSFSSSSIDSPDSNVDILAPHDSFVEVDGSNSMPDSHNVR